MDLVTQADLFYFGFLMQHYLPEALIVRAREGSWVVVVVTSLVPMGRLVL